jgi:hypothetical protein
MGHREHIGKQARPGDLCLVWRTRAKTQLERHCPRIGVADWEYVVSPFTIMNIYEGDLSLYTLICTDRG